MIHLNVAVRSVGVDIGSVGKVDFGVVIVILSVDTNVVCVGEVGVSVVPVVVLLTQEAAHGRHKDGELTSNDSFVIIAIIICEPGKKYQELVMIHLKRP
jgi:hypothetical protein